MQNDILFDNIYIGHSAEDADELRKETFVPKLAAEKAEEEANAPKPADPVTDPSDLKFTEDPVKYAQAKLNLFIEIAKRDPVEAIKFVPEVAGTIGALAVGIIALLASLLGGSSAPSKEQLKAQAKKAKDAAADAKDKAAEAVSTGAEKAQAEVNKRTTRSNAS
jgi:calnexin